MLGLDRQRRNAIRRWARRAVALIEHVDPALDAGEGLDALALEPDQDAGRVLVGPATNLAGLARGGVDDLAGALLGHLHQLAVLEHACRLLLSTADDRISFLPRTLGDAARLLGHASSLG